MDNLTDLINMAQALLDNGFDVEKFEIWRNLAFVCLFGLLGPLNYYTKNFLHFTKHVDSQSLLAGEGILETARLSISEDKERIESNGKLQPIKCSSKFIPWLRRKKKWCPLASIKSNQ
jgi:hypothetical protein